MYEGNVSVEPYELSGKEACTYCDYKSVCGFDPMLKGCDWRILEPLGEEEVLMRMKKEAQEEAEDKETGKESMKEQE
jgi:ATP-dependent helicase/nuclease subunit B